MSIDLLQTRIQALKTPLMLDLAPTPEAIPPQLLADAQAAYGQTPKAAAMACRAFCLGLLDGLQNCIPAVRIPSACLASLGPDGASLTTELLLHAKQLGYYVLLDRMYSEEPPIAALCAQAHFGPQATAPCDGLTLSGYRGSDCVKPFLPYCSQEKSLFVLVKSPERSSVEIQDLLSGGRLVHTAMADLVNRWGAGLYGSFGYSQVGAMVSASHPEPLRLLRAKYDRMFFLVTGFSASGGVSGGASARFAFDRLGRGAVICTPRSLLTAWQNEPDDDFVAAAQAETLRIRKNLAKYVTVL